MKKLLSMIVIVLGGASAALPAVPASLTTLRAIHSLTNAEASLALPVAFEATITYFRSYELTLFVQDEDAGIYVQATTNLVLVPGDRILVRGVTHGSFRPYVESADIKLVHHGPLPRPIPATYGPMVQSKLDCMYVAVHGAVRSAEMSLSSGRQVTQLELRIDGGYVGVIMDSGDPGKLNGLLDSEVEVDGALSGRFDGKMQQTGLLLHVPSFDSVKILHRASVDAWQIPATPMNEVLSAANFQDLSSRVRVQGTITYYHPNSMAVLQDGSRSIRVLTSAINPLRVGDRAEAIGIPFVDNGFLTLKLGDIRSTGAAAPIIPTPVNWSDLATGKRAFDLVSIEGTVVTQVREHAQDVYMISTEGHLFPAAVRHPFVYEWNVSREPPPMPEISPGSKVRVTGVALMDEGNPFNGAVAFGILLRTSSDVTVLATPSWWTVRNMTYVIGLLLALVLAAIARGWTLERKVRLQTSALAKRIEAEAALERRMAQLEQRRSRILEEINGAEPLAGVLERIAELVSLTLGGASCWCEITGGARLGRYPDDVQSLRVIRGDIPARSGPPLGTLSAGLDPKEKASGEESEALAMGTRLATLAIETRRLYSDLLHRSEFDLLTDIHNRFSLDSELESCIAEARETASIFGLIYIDLDDFKLVNDLYGHHVGDLYLQQVALRMKRQLRGGDMLARLGGDEFAALVPKVRNRAQVEEIALRMEHCFDDPIAIEGNLLRGSASVGYAIYPENGASRDSLLNSADAAMYVAKHAKRHTQLERAHPALTPEDRS